VKPHVADQLMYRHWNVWDEGARSHLFVVSAEAGAPRIYCPEFARRASGIVWWQ
jgi:hypothetical protein